MVTISTADKALKTFYLGVLADQLNVGVNPLLAKIGQTSADVWGKEVKKLAPYGINGGVGSGEENDNLPQSGGNNYAQFTLTLKNLFGKIELSDKAIRASQNNAGAFVNLLNAEMDGLLKASKFNFGRMLYGYGSGLLATTVTNTTGAKNKIQVDDIKGLIEGMTVDVYSSAGVKDANISGGRITSIDRENKIVTLSQSAYGDQNDFIMKKVFTDTGRIYKDSIVLCGDKIMFCAEDGVYAFDGYDAVKVGKEFPLAKDKRETCAGYLENKYYLACKVDEFGGDGNNAVVRYDTETKDVSVLSGVRVSSLCAVKTSNGADLICTFQDGNKNKLGMMSESGKIFDTATQKVYKSPETMLGYPLSKTVRGVSIFTKYPIELDVIFDGKRYAFNVEGSDMQRYVPIEKCGVRIAFEIKTAQQNAHIAPIFVDVDVERSRL